MSWWWTLQKKIWKLKNKTKKNTKTSKKTIWSIPGVWILCRKFHFWSNYNQSSQTENCQFHNQIKSNSIQTFKSTGPRNIGLLGWVKVSQEKLAVEKNLIRKPAFKVTRHPLRTKKHVRNNGCYRLYESDFLIYTSKCKLSKYKVGTLGH